MRTLEQYFRDELKSDPTKIDYSIRISETENGVIQFYIHPIGKDGDTLDCLVIGKECQTFQDPKESP